MGNKDAARRPSGGSSGNLLVVVAVVVLGAMTLSSYAGGDDAPSLEAEAKARQQLAEVAKLNMELAGVEASRDAALASRDEALLLASTPAAAPPAAAAPPPAAAAPPPRPPAAAPPPPPPRRPTDAPPANGYGGYTFWSSDFHISPIADLKDIFNPMGMKIIDESLSGHCHLKKTCSKDLKVITKQNGIDLGRCPNKLRRQFFETYKRDARLRGVDAFLCHHAAGLCEVFMPFNASLVVVASTRYEIGRHDAGRWRAWNENLKAIAAHPRNVVAANNRYDAEYVKYFTGLKDVPVLPNYCGYTGATYAPARNQILVGPGRGVSNELFGMLRKAADRRRGACKASAANKALCGGGGSFDFRRIRDLYPHFEYSDLAAHPAVVLIPYQVSIMSIFEYYRMGIPMFAPHPNLMAKWQLKYRVMSERTWDLVRHKGRPSKRSALPQAPGGTYPHDPNDEFDEDAIAWWIKFADFYEWPHIETFDSFDDLLDKLASPDLDLARASRNVRAYNKQMVDDLAQTWQGLFHKMFHGLKPARDAPKDQLLDYDAAMLAKYGAAPSGCVGDAHGQRPSDWLAL